MHVNMLLVLFCICICICSSFAMAKDARNSAESVFEEQFHFTSVTKGPVLTKLAHQLQSVALSMYVRKDVKSAMSVFKERIPKDQDLSFVTKTHQPAWFTPLPQKVKDVYYSMQNVLVEVEANILGMKVNAAPEPTATGAMVAGELVAAGLVGAMAVL